jgi:hypothetical protein
MMPICSIDVPACGNPIGVDPLGLRQIPHPEFSWTKSNIG